ncbi:MAG: hypothetical protein LBF41_08935, partial [Deltaproteobacteria bacterium]|nr:hypothetical protein [Deltaproteobacteria bacterium]
MTPEKPRDGSGTETTPAATPPPTPAGRDADRESDGDLIAAISTAAAAGTGAVAMIRLSGKGVRGALSRIFLSKTTPVDRP